IRGYWRGRVISGCNSGHQLRPAEDARNSGVHQGPGLIQAVWHESRPAVGDGGTVGARARAVAVVSQETKTDIYDWEKDRGARRMHPGIRVTDLVAGQAVRRDTRVGLAGLVSKRFKRWVGGETHRRDQT